MVKVSDWVRLNAHRCVVARAILEMAECAAADQGPPPEPLVERERTDLTSDNLSGLKLT